MNKSVLTDLCSLDGISGREHAVRNYILDKLNANCVPKDITVDALGNVIVHLYGKSPAEKIVLFDAHMDEVGILITGYNSDGTLRFSTVGGINDNALLGQRVRFGSVNGVIGGKTVHQCSSEEKNATVRTDAMSVDIGTNCRESAEKLIKVGQWGTFASGIRALSEDFFVGKAMDDRVGCAILLALAEKQPKRDIWLSFSVQEEIGLRGAKVVGEAVRPEIAVVIEATTASDIGDSSEKDSVCCVGSGPVVSFADKATLYDHDLYKHIRSIAESNGIPTQTKSKIAGGNNAGAIQRSYTGVRTAAVSLPCRYIHTASGVACWRDVEALEELVALLAERLTI